jgi:hypothetical protein
VQALLQDLAKAHEIGLEVLLRSSLEDWLNSQKSEFVDAADYGSFVPSVLKAQKARRGKSVSF